MIEYVKALIVIFPPADGINGVPKKPGNGLSGRHREPDGSEEFRIAQARRPVRWLPDGGFCQAPETTGVFDQAWIAERRNGGLWRNPRRSAGALWAVWTRRQTP